MYQLNKTHLENCFEIIPNIFTDHRGVNIKTFHKDTFKKIGIECNFGEDLLVFSEKNVLRGLHYQNPPYAQAKLIYCVRGSILDVVVDIRRGSPTYGKYQIFNLSSEKHNTLYIGEGFAHGYLTLEDHTIVMYKLSSVYKPEFEGGIKWDSLGIPWNIEKPLISSKDENLLPFSKFISEFIY